MFKSYYDYILVFLISYLFLRLYNNESIMKNLLYSLGFSCTLMFIFGYLDKKASEKFEDTEIPEDLDVDTEVGFEEPVVDSVEGEEAEGAVEP